MVKFSIYFNRRVFVMKINVALGNKNANQGLGFIETLQMTAKERLDGHAF